MQRGKFDYPEAKTPVAKRKNKGSAAPKTSPDLSGLTAKRLGSGGLKLGGGANDTEEEGEASDIGGSCSVLTEVEVEGVSDMALMQTLLLGSFLGNEIGLYTENWERLKAPPAIAMTQEKGQVRSFLQPCNRAVLFCWELCDPLFLLLCLDGNLYGQSPTTFKERYLT
ncbi:hypothetical protein SESBI_15114 [Sesbania bispinosa]|nr:hypothetical protein SESBI_15114 [Sesbania bispinosa]